MTPLQEEIIELFEEAQRRLLPRPARRFAADAGAAADEGLRQDSHTANILRQRAMRRLVDAALIPLRVLGWDFRTVDGVLEKCCQDCLRWLPLQSFPPKHPRYGHGRRLGRCHTCAPR
jgi:hypothetical protein